MEVKKAKRNETEAAEVTQGSGEQKKARLLGSNRKRALRAQRKRRRKQTHEKGRKRNSKQSKEKPK